MKAEWWGRFVVTYDDVDIEQFTLNSTAPLRDSLIADARKKARKASPDLTLEGAHINGERSAEVIFVTTNILKSYPSHPAGSEMGKA